MDQVAKRAGANKAMIYYHFGSKLGLYREVLLQLFGGIVDEVDYLRLSKLSPQQRLGALYGRIARHFEEKKGLPHILLREILAGGRSMDAEAARALGSILGFVRDTLEEGARAGAFRPVHPLLFHVSMLGPLLLHFAGASFRERMLPRVLPGLPSPGNEEVVIHLLEVLDRTLAPVNTRGSVS